MKANAYLERVLIAEMKSEDNSNDIETMLHMIGDSRQQLVAAQEALRVSIQIGEEQGNPYLGDFEELRPNQLAASWHQSLLVNCQDEIKALGGEIKTNYLATSIRFVETIQTLITSSAEAENVLQVAADFARDHDLKRALEENNIPLQTVFATHLSMWLQLMKEYLVDSLIATEVVFRAKGTTLLRTA